jgi:hypothetical protein
MDDGQSKLVKGSGLTTNRRPKSDKESNEKKKGKTDRKTERTKKNIKSERNTERYKKQKKQLNTEN